MPDYGMPVRLDWLITDYKKKTNIDFSSQMWKWQNIYQNRFRYKNLPDSIPADVIEYFQFYNQNLCWFKDEVLDELFVLPVVGSMNLNIYWRMNEWRVVGGNGYNKVRNVENSVLQFNDNNRSIPFFMILPWVLRIEESLQSEEQNITASKVPYVFYGDEQEYNSILREWDQIKKGKPFVVKRKGVNNQGNNLVMQTGVSYITNEIQTSRRAYEAEILSYLGIQNISQEKAERVNVSEVETLNKLAELNLQAQFDKRRACIAAVNQMFGTNIEVEMNEGVEAGEYDISPNISGGAGVPLYR